MSVNAGPGGPSGGGNVIRKIVWLSGSVVVGALVAFSWQDMLRYAKMRGISAGKGHPEVVPVEGKTSYPQDAAHATPDGVGEFDSALRGGPPHVEPGSPVPGEARRA
jgi:hypothetical protein